MKLQTLLKDLPINQLTGDKDRPVQGMYIDSRQVTAESCFIAIKGTLSDGHAFLDKAIEKGATTLVVEHMPEVLHAQCTYVLVKDSAQAAGLLADAFYEHPSRQLKLVGVTGTNGKTTTVTLLYQLFSNLGYKTGLLSTVENRIGQLVIPSTHTTPDTLTLHKLLREMVDAGCTYAFMEVSSHAVVQQRIAGVWFTGGVFSNITHDHLDYHGTFAEYIKAKKGFFDGLPKEAFALVNVDDKRGTVMLQNTAARTYSFALLNMADFKGKILENGRLGLHLVFDGAELFTRMIGDFNAYNLLSIYAVARLLGISEEEALVHISALEGAAGRFEQYYSPEREVLAVVDYAHTPDALEQVIATAKALQKGFGRVITVVGCGGDRDKTKRPVMGGKATQLSDMSIFTADNPRSEDPEAILQDMVNGVATEDQHKLLVITDRRQAIRTAIQLAQRGDLVLVAGKGHETYQEIQGVKHPFDDRTEVKNYLIG